MTQKPRRRSDRQARQSIVESREMARSAAKQGEQIDLDPASELFLAFASPLLTQARSDEEFQAATAIAEFAWTTSHFNAATQMQMLNQFIEDNGVPDEMVPWLLEVYAELAERRQILEGK